MLQRAKFDIMDGDCYKCTLESIIDDTKEYYYDELSRVILATRPSLINNPNIRIYQVPVNNRLVNILLKIIQDESEILISTTLS